MQISRQYFLLRTVILQKKVAGCWTTEVALVKAAKYHESQPDNWWGLPHLQSQGKAPWGRGWIFFTQVIVMEKNLDITKPHYSEQILQFFGPLLYRGSTVICNLVPRAFPLKNGWGQKRAFSRPTHFLREKPWGRSCVIWKESNS